MKQRKLFCEMNPLFYAISEKKEIIKRHLSNFTDRKSFAGTFSAEKLPNILSQQESGLIKRGKGIDPVLQENKAVNIALACAAMNGIVISPGETFSFWRLVGNTTKRKGYKDGRVIIGDKLIPGIGGGLCNLANTINLLALHSPLDITEFHTHSDALAPDGDKRIPMSSGTSVSYNYIDLRFKNNTDQKIQLILYCRNERLYGELRSERAIPRRYEIVEEGHHFRSEGGKYFRISKIYRNVIDTKTEKIIRRDLIRDNHSEVMYDYSLIPKEVIKET